VRVGLRAALLLVGVMLVLGCRPAYAYIAFWVGPPRPNWEDARRGMASRVAAFRAKAELEARDTTRRLDVRCDPTCAVVSFTPRGGALAVVAPSEEGARRAFAGLSLVGDLRGAEDLRLVSARIDGDAHVYTFDRGRGPIACECSVEVRMGRTGEVVRVEGRRLLGYDALPPEARYTRGEALDAALRQLVAEKPRLTDRAGLEEPELSALVVVPVADRAVLAHRFALTLDALPFVVDVDDATLGVARVNIDRRFNRSPVGVSIEADIREQIAPDPILAE